VEITQLLIRAFELGASDLHLRLPSKPVLRIDGSLVIQEDFPIISADYMNETLNLICTPEQKSLFFRELELDFAYTISSGVRFRVNVMRQRGSISMAFRVISSKIPTIDDLALPQICKQLIMKPSGLILVTGPTGSGKTTTMAAMIEYRNNNKSSNVITIEDPIEYLYRNKKCFFAQRELEEDTRSFSSALKHALRHDPDVILIGEMRDIETISIAIRAAETGHLVLSTLHAVNPPQTIDRLIDVFPPNQQNQIRMQVAQTIEGILSQRLIPKAGGKGRIAAFEILLGVSAARNLIRESENHKLSSLMEMGRKDGMLTLDQSLVELVNKHIIDLDEALLQTNNPANLRKMVTQY
jgi:twitching motility protein PilT